MQVTSDIFAPREAKPAPAPWLWPSDAGMPSALRSLRDGCENLRQAMVQTESAWNETAVKKALSQSELDADAAAFMLTLVLLAHRLHYAESTTTGTTLARRLKIGAELQNLPDDLRWTADLLLAPKLPLLVENAIQEIMRITVSLDRTKLTQESRSTHATDDLFTVITQEWIGEQHSILPLPLASFIARAASTLLSENLQRPGGFTDESVHTSIAWCGVGEEFTELQRFAANMALMSGTNPQMLRRSLLTRMRGVEPDAIMRSVVSLRIGLLFQELRMPLAVGDPLPWQESVEVTAADQVSVVVANLLRANGPSRNTPAVEKLLQAYVLPLKKNGMDLDAEATPTIIALAEVHSALQKAECGLAVIFAPRWFLHSHRALGLRECLLQDFEQIHIFDLHGDGLLPDDAPVTGVEGACLLVLSRNAALRQWTHYASIAGTRLHKLHSLQMKEWGNISWERIAPERPGYLFLPR